MTEGGGGGGGRDDNIRAKAYELWEQAGRPEGQEAEHWAEAERLVDAEGASTDEAKAPDRAEPEQPPPDQVEARQPSATDTVERKVVVRRKKKGLRQADQFVELTTAFSSPGPARHCHAMSVARACPRSCLAGLSPLSASPPPSPPGPVRRLGI